MKTNQDLGLQIAASLDLPESLSPCAAQLMNGIDALGSYPSDTVALCKKVGITAKSTVLDLACGKGSIAIELTATLGCTVTAVDASSDFIQSAKSLAKLRGVRPRFIVSDVCTFKSSKKFDVVIMLNLFPMEEAAEFCRTFVKPGGILILDDATLAPGEKDKRWLSVAEVKESLEAEGDKVVAVRRIPAATVSKVGLAIEKQVLANGTIVSKIQPELRRPVTAYLNRLKQSRKLLTVALRPTLCAVKIGSK